ncbi:FAD dependent oxidoreductase-like protein [Melanomma pulvis-pyrius CBS 109.77]|uniref:FAD dependent oxidoreductase-like protein n=1 Tax=Melanomma pulvis-pyrius CBS 109.77 TaxID=1314802 RepID=A0A6A6X4Y7_9PLEO|nr:FAD dependent oxidoreductase-like protein [Melanomma pulvis-pyrius CBS 109.77]
MEERGSIKVGLPVEDPLPSYWHDPVVPVANVTDPDPKYECTHVIVGSGISGALIAHKLLASCPEASIIMLEAREACSGATGRNGGHTKAASYRAYAQHREELGVEEALRIARLEYANIRETHVLARELGIQCESQECNTVDLIYDQETFQRGREAIEALRRDAMAEEREEGGMAWYKMYGKEEAMVKFWGAERNTNPEVKEEEELVGAFEYRAGRINAYRFTTGLLNLCVQKGLLLFTNAPVQQIMPDSENTVTGKVSNIVITPQMTVLTRFVIFATNGYTAFALPSLQGAIVPLRGQITAQRVGKAAKFPTPLPTTYSFIYQSGYEYMIPRPLPDGGQHIVIGGGLGRQPEAGINEYGTIDNSVLNNSISKYLHGSLVGYFGGSNWGEDPDDKSKRIVREWGGIMGATSDGRPFVGEVPGEKSVWISAGFNGHGMVLCLKSAEALVQKMNGGKLKEIDWFPSSFWISEKRLSNQFSGRTDMRVPETGGGPVA